MLNLPSFCALYLLGHSPVLGYTNPSCQLACVSLSQTLSEIHFSSLEAQVPLWSQFQARVQPLCRVEPRQSQEVAEILAVIRQYNCHFAILGGGTSPFKGASTVEQGITIDMRRMKEIAYIDNENLQFSVGAGNLWADVYAELQSWSMSALGTRNSLTGVVGSTLGGKPSNYIAMEPMDLQLTSTTGVISFFSERYGWACDSVVEFELVLANSTTVKTSQIVNSDLFWALKGGGNNFGIVTRVTIETFRSPPRYYTFQMFNMEDLAAIFDRLEMHTATIPPYVWQIATTLGWHVPTQRFVISERMVTSELPELPESIPCLDQDGTWKESSVLQTNVYERSILAMAQKMDSMNEEGFFNLFGSLTVQSNTQVSIAFARIFQEEVDLIRDVDDLQVYIVYNPLTLNAMRQMKRRGGNALGLSEEHDPLIVVNINLHWSDERFESRMRHFMRRLTGQFQECAASMDMLHPYIFQNHAFKEQDVFPGYGEGNVTRTKSLRLVVDPNTIFQELQPGFFKLEPQLPTGQWTKSEL